MTVGAAPGPAQQAEEELLARWPENRCHILGILNVTPDSFSDGGRYDSRRAAVAHGVRMARSGADYVDVGGESTRPGSRRVDTEEELARVLPVVEGLARQGLAVSIDTTQARVAAAALAAGAVMVNDVSGGRADPDMGRVVAEAGVPWVLMHWRGHSVDTDSSATYGDVVADVRRELLERVDEAVSAGVAERQIVLDPGLGFAKRPPHDLALLRGLDAIIGLGFPVLVGASRKSLLGGGARRVRRPAAPAAAALCRDARHDGAGRAGGRLGGARARSGRNRSRCARGRRRRLRPWPRRPTRRRRPGSRR